MWILHVLAFSFAYATYLLHCLHIILHIILHNLLHILHIICIFQVVACSPYLSAYSAYGEEYVWILHIVHIFLHIQLHILLINHIFCIFFTIFANQFQFFFVTLSCKLCYESFQKAKLHRFNSYSKHIWDRCGLLGQYQGSSNFSLTMDLSPSPGQSILYILLVLFCLFSTSQAFHLSMASWRAWKSQVCKSNVERHINISNMCNMGNMSSMLII